MLLNTIANILARSIVLETATGKEEIPSGYPQRENKELKEKETVLIMDDVRLTYSSVEDALRAAELFKKSPDSFPDFPRVIKELSDKEYSFENIVRSGAYNLVVFYVEKEEDYKKLQSFQAPADCKMMISSNKAQAKEMGAPFPGVYCYNAAEKNGFSMELPENLATLVPVLSLRSLETINAENIRFFQTLSAKMFYFITNEEITYEDAVKKYGGVTKKTTKDVKVVFFKPSDVPVLDNLLRLETKDYPVLVHMDEAGKYCVKNVTAQNMEKGIKSLLDGSAAKVVFKSVLPEDNESRLIRVHNTDTLPKERGDKGMDKLFVFHSPNCGYCKQLMPELEALAKILKEKSVSIHFGTYNTIENEQIADLNVTSVPKLFFKKKGSTEMVAVEGARDVPALLKYLSENGESSKISMDDYKEHLPKEEEAPVEEEKDEEEAAETKEML